MERERELIANNHAYFSILPKAGLQAEMMDDIKFISASQTILCPPPELLI